MSNLLQFIRKLTTTTSDAPFVGTDNPLPTNPLRALTGTPVAQAVSATSASVALPAGATAVHFNCVGCNARIRFGAGAQTAVATDLRVIDSAIYDMAVPTGATHIGIIADSSGTGSLSLSARAG